MNRSLRRKAFPAGIALALMTTVACKSDVTASADDALANDSTLALTVLQATGDSVTPFEGGEESLMTADATTAAGKPRLEPAPVRATTRSRPARTTSSQPRQRPATNVRNVSTRTTASRPANIKPAAPARAWLVIPAGSQFELAAEQRVCSSTAAEGDLFSATVSEPLIRAGGTIIPEGASARGQVVSLDDSKIVMRVQSLLIDGRTYPLDSRISYAQTRKVRGGQCLPDGGKMIAELTQPLRILLTE